MFSSEILRTLLERVAMKLMSLISVRISAAISLLALAMFGRPVSEFVVHSFVSCVL